MKQSLDNTLFITKTISDVNGEELEEKRIQRLVYLIESFGKVQVGYKYDIFFFGPFSPKLSEDLIVLIGQGNISLDDNKNIKVLLYDSDEELDLDLKEKESVVEIVKRFGKRSIDELELLSTTQYIADLLGDNKNPEAIEAGVKKLNKRKYDEGRILNAAKELQLA